MLSFYPTSVRAGPAATTSRVCRAEACQSVGAHALADHAQQQPRRRLRRDDAGRLRHPRPGVLPRQLRPRPGRPGRRIQLLGRVDADRFDASSSERRARRRHGHDHASMSRATRPRAPSAPTRSPTGSARRRRSPTATIRVVRNGSRGHAVARASRRGRSPTRVASPTARSPPTTSPLSPPGCFDGADHPLCLGPTDELRWLQGQTAADVRTGRRDRPALARGLPGQRWRRRTARALSHDARRRRRGGHRRPACAVVAAPASRPASSGRPCLMRRGRPQVRLLQRRRGRQRAPSPTGC